MIIPYYRCIRDVLLRIIASVISLLSYILLLEAPYYSFRGYRLFEVPIGWDAPRHVGVIRILQENPCLAQRIYPFIFLHSVIASVSRVFHLNVLVAYIIAIHAIMFFYILIALSYLQLFIRYFDVEVRDTLSLFLLYVMLGLSISLNYNTHKMIMLLPFFGAVTITYASLYALDKGVLSRNRFSPLILSIILVVLFLSHFVFEIVLFTITLLVIMLVRFKKKKYEINTILLSILLSAILIGVITILDKYLMYSAVMFLYNILGLDYFATTDAPSVFKKYLLALKYYNINLLRSSQDVNRLIIMPRFGNIIIETIFLVLLIVVTLCILLNVRNVVCTKRRGYGVSVTYFTVFSFIVMILHWVNLINIYVIRSHIPITLFDYTDRLMTVLNIPLTISLVIIFLCNFFIKRKNHTQHQVRFKLSSKYCIVTLMLTFMILSLHSWLFLNTYVYEWHFEMIWITRHEYDRLVYYGSVVNNSKFIIVTNVDKPKVNAIEGFIQMLYGYRAYMFFGNISDLCKIISVNMSAYSNNTDVTTWSPREKFYYYRYLYIYGESIRKLVSSGENFYVLIDKCYYRGFNFSSNYGSDIYVLNLRQLAEYCNMSVS